MTEKSKIIKTKLTDPELSIRDISKQTGKSRMTVARTIEHIPDGTTRDMIDKLDEIIDTIIDIQKISINRFQEKAIEEWLSTKEVKDLSDIGKTNRERKQILEWKPTDITKLDFSLDWKSMKELDELRKNLLN